MYKNKLSLIIVSLIVLSMVLASCAKATPEVEVKPTEPSVPEPTEAAPAVTEEAIVACPPSTVADPQGVPAGTYPQQFDLDEYEGFTECEMTFSDNPFFADLVAAGTLPPVEERLPDEPLVSQPYEAVGQYGGRMRGVNLGPISGSSEFLTFKHQNLVRYLDDLNTIVPNIAKSWEWNEDYTELTFTLRKGHKWSDGEPFTADDIVFWWEDIMLNEELTPEVPSFWKAGGEPMTVTKIDDVTVKWSFAESAPWMLMWLGRTWVNPFVPKHFYSQFFPKYNPDAGAIAEEMGYETWTEVYFHYRNEWRDNPGSPVLDSHIPIEYTSDFRLFQPNPYYFKVDTVGQQLPYITEQHESWAPEQELIDLKVIGGEIDYKAQTLSVASIPLYIENQEAGQYYVQLPPYGGGGNIYAPNITHQDPVLREVFSDVRFREALSLAINRADINEAACLGMCNPEQGIPAHPTVSFAEPWMFEYLTEYDPERANQLLDAMGLEKGADGFRLRPDGEPLVILMEYCEQAGSVITHELVKEFWGAVGVKAELKQVSSEAYRLRSGANEHDIGIWGNMFNLEPVLFSNPIRMIPPFGDPVLSAQTGLPWYDWWITDGEDGEEPPEEVKDLFDMVEEWQTTLPESDEYLSLGKDILQIHLDNMWNIGILSAGPAPTVISCKMRNVPQITIQTFDYYRLYPFRPDQFFFVDECRIP